MPELSAAQRAAVEAEWEDTRTLIVACAGSGKTTVLAYRAVRIAAELHSGTQATSSDAQAPMSDRCPSDGGDASARAKIDRRPAVLCLCFGTDAADELAERISGVISEQKREGELICVRKFPQRLGLRVVVVHVSTLHAFGNHILHIAGPRDRKDVCGLRASEKRLLPEVISYRDRAALIEMCMREVGLRVPDKETKSGRDQLRSLTSRYSRKVRRYKAFCCDMENMNQVAANGARLEEFGDIRLLGQELQLHQLYCEKLLERNQIEFSDMLSMSLALLNHSEHVAGAVSTMYDAVLVDEFQDVSPSELALVKHISPNVSFVGDDDQTIYSFKNAVVNWLCLRQAAAMWADMRTLTLAENRRCAANIVAFASAVVTNISGRMPKELIAARPKGVPVEIVGTASAKLEAEFVAQKIRKLVEAKKVEANSSSTRLGISFRDIAVLGRVNANLTRLMRRVKEVDPDLPVSRHLPKISTTKKREVIGALTAATLQLLSLAAKVTDDDEYVDAATALFPDLPPDLALRARSERACHEILNECNNNDALRRLLAATSAVIELPRACSALGGIVLGTLDIVSSRIGIPNDGEESSQELPYSEKQWVPQHNKSPLKRKRPATSEMIPELAGLDLILETARRIDSESAELPQGADGLDSETTTTTASAQVAATSGDLESGRDEGAFLSLITRDVHQRQTRRRSSLGVSATPRCAQPNSAGTAGVRRAVIMGKLRMLVGVAREKFSAAGRDKTSDSVDQDELFERDTVRFLTVHKAKGSQYKHVILCGADSESFPVEGSVMREHMTSVEFSCFVNEERRVFYVACTRAIDSLTVCFHRRVPETIGDAQGRVWPSASPFAVEAVSKVPSEGVAVRIVRSAADLGIGTPPHPGP